MTQQEMKEIVRQARENVLSTSVNENGEELILVATEDGCDIITKQSNGWRRVNGYSTTGAMMYETYDGRWDQNEATGN